MEGGHDSISVAGLKAGWTGNSVRQDRDVSWVATAAFIAGDRQFLVGATAEVN